MVDRVDELALKDVVPVVETEEGNLRVFPAIVQGRLARYLGRAYPEYVRANFGGNPVLMDAINYDSQHKVLIGSSFIGLNVLGQMVRAENSTLDVTNLRDLNDPNVVRLIKDTYLDAGDGLVLRGTQNFYDPRDKAIFESLAERVGKLDKPVLIRGLKVEHLPGDNSGYGLRVVPTDKFSCIPDDRLSQAGKFNEADEFGLPKLTSDGEFNWHVSNYAISGLIRYSANLSAGGDLAIWNRNGRVVLVSREAGALDLSRIVDEGARYELSTALRGTRDTIDNVLGKIGN